jgi:hypothetical protein
VRHFNSRVDFATKRDVADHLGELCPCTH